MATGPQKREQNNNAK